jgi:hypothetical protein
MRANDPTARCLLLIAGLFLLLETLFGLIASLILDTHSIRDIVTALCLTLGFPIYLLGLRSIRMATIALWVFFVAQWVNGCLLSIPPALYSPFDWWHGDVLVASIVLVQVGYLLLLRGRQHGKSLALRDAFIGHALP